jgi:hypothetical protein
VTGPGAGSPASGRRALQQGSPTASAARRTRSRSRSSSRQPAPWQQPRLLPALRALRGRASSAGGWGLTPPPASWMCPARTATGGTSTAAASTTLHSTAPVSAPGQAGRQAGAWGCTQLPAAAAWLAALHCPSTRPLPPCLPAASIIDESGSTLPKTLATGFFGVNMDNVGDLQVGAAAAGPAIANVVACLHTVCQRLNGNLHL